MNKLGKEHQRGAATVADVGHKGFGVAASPLNIVKLELGVVFFVAVVLWFGVDSITANLKEQLLVLALYGITCMGWILYRTKRILLRRQSSLTSEGGNAQ